MNSYDKRNENFCNCGVKKSKSFLTFKENYETTIHCGSTKQIARIIKINKDCLRTGDISIVKFRFKKNPEFIQEKKQIIFREGQTKGIGIITKLIS